VSQIIRGQGGGKAADLLFGEDGNIAGAPLDLSINADPTRIDFIVEDNWLRVETQPIDLYKLSTGETRFPPYGASGGIAAAELFYWIWIAQTANVNPAQGGYIDSLTYSSLV